MKEAKKGRVQPAWMIALAGALKKRGIDQKYLLHVLLLPAVFFAAYFFLNLGFLRGPHEESGDMAINALQIERAKHFSECLGPYSRFGFNHPGPVSFYFFAAAEKIFSMIPTPTGRHSLGQLILNLFFLLISLHILYRSLPKKYDAILLFCALVFVLSPAPLGADILFRIWPPNLLIMPMLAFVLASVKLALGEMRYFLPAALSAVFITQNNVSSLIIVFPFVILTLVMYLLNRKKQAVIPKKVDRYSLVCGLLFLIIAFLPPIYEQLTSRPGNLAKIVGFFGSQKAIPHTFDAASDYVFDYFKAPLSLLGIESSLLFFLLSFFVILNVTRKRSFANYLVAFLFLGIFSSILGAMRIPSELMHYILLYEVAFVVLFYFLGIRLLLSVFRLSDVRRSAVFIFLVLTVSLTAFKFYRARPLNPPDPKIGMLLAAIKPDKSSTYELFLKNGGENHDQWGVMAGLALKMKRNGYQVCVPKELVYLFGRQMATGIGVERYRRVTFYATDKHRTRVRRGVFTFEDTTIEFGDFIPLALPLRLDGAYPDEYFENWNRAENGMRQMIKQEARIFIPLGDVAIRNGKRFFLRISAFSHPGERFQVKWNEQFLAEFASGDLSIDSLIPIASERVKPHQVNTVELVSLAQARDSSPAQFYFNLKEIELTSGDQDEARPTPQAGMKQVQ